MDITCPKCKRPTEVVYDHETGETVCSECGIVLRNKNHNENNTDIGNDATNQILATSPTTTPTTTVVSSPEGKNHLKLSNTTTFKTNRHLPIAFARLETMAKRLGLAETIKDRGCKLYKKIFYEDNPKTCRARNLDAMLAGCLLVACQEEQLPRTLKELFSVIKDGNATRREVMKSKVFIIQQLSIAVAATATATATTTATAATTTNILKETVLKATSFVKRFCCNLGIVDDRVLKAAQETAANCEDNLDLRRSPISVAATVIYIVIQLTRDDKEGAARPVSMKEIADATQVAEGTIRNTYRDIYPHATRIVPQWYANVDKIRDLLCHPLGGNHGYSTNLVVIWS